MSRSISFWQMNEAYRAAAASANDRVFNDNTVAKLFTKANPGASTVPSVMTPTDSTSIINGFGQAVLNHSMSAAIQAAKAANERVNQQVVAANNQMTKKPIGDHSGDVTYSGVLKVDFGNEGQALGGGYRFLSGKALKAAFKVAVGAKKSNGETIDTVKVQGETLTGSTSGSNAHDVFTLKLRRESGVYNFKLLAPIDQNKKKGSYNSVYLNGLMQGITSTGRTISAPKVEMDIYNDLGAAGGKKNWGILHEAALTYQDPSKAASNSKASTKAGTSSGSSSTSGTNRVKSNAAVSAYKAPTDPRTNRGYTSNPSAIWSVINSVNIFS